MDSRAIGVSRNVLRNLNEPHRHRAHRAFGMAARDGGSVSGRREVEPIDNLPCSRGRTVTRYAGDGREPVVACVWTFCRTEQPECQDALAAYERLTTHSARRLLTTRTRWRCIFSITISSEFTKRSRSALQWRLVLRSGFGKCLTWSKCWRLKLPGGGPASMAV